MADTFMLQDSDGNKYAAVRVEGPPSYRLADGRALNVNNDGEVVTFTIVENGVVLTHADQ